MNPIPARVLVLAFAVCGALAGVFASPAIAATPSPYAANASVGIGAPNQPDGTLPVEQPYRRYVPATTVTAATLPVELLSGAPPVPRITSTFDVTSAADTGSASFRAAIAAANANPGTDLITFHIGSGLRTIQPATPLPSITQPVVIDGTTQPGFVGSPLIEIDGSLMPEANGLLILAGSSTVRGLIINRFRSAGGAGHGIVIDVGSTNVIQGNWFGLNAAGTAAAGNAGNGIAVFGGSTANIIGGTTAATRNVMSGNGSSGIGIASGNVGGNIVRGNWVGLNATGTAAVPNGGNGIFTDAPNCLIGGTVPGSGNIVSGNVLPGIFIGFSASSTIIQGNWVGTDATGTVDLGNQQNGINLDQVNNTTIGGATPEARNVVGGNEFPNIYVLGPATGTKIHGNYIGTNATGMAALGDGNGVVIDNAADNQLGGSAFGEGNLISGHTAFPAVVILTGTGNRVRGNRIGTNEAGTAPLTNSKGILVVNAPRTVIGGQSPNERNLISGNEIYGLELRNSPNCRASGNFIGTDVTGTLDVGNKLHGVVIIASNDTIGGTSELDANVIAFNGRTGVYDSTGTGNLIRYNRLFDNRALGIDLFPRGIVANDLFDSDTGANDGQNFPLLDSTSVRTGTTRIYGRLPSKASTAYTVDLFTSDGADTAHFGEGRTYLGSVNVNTDVTGNSFFVYDPGYLISDLLFVTATAKDANGNTSEFSQTLCLADRDNDGIRDCWESPGWPIDVNSDGIYDLDIQARGADPNYVDVFVEIDAMNGFDPPANALTAVEVAFANLPAAELEAAPNVQGIRLHTEPSDLTIPVQTFPSDFDAAYQAVKDQWFGTGAEHDPNAVWARTAKRMFYRYGLWARMFESSPGLDSTSSGYGEGSDGDGGDDFMVTFGSTGDHGWHSTRDAFNHAGTFMHELGHTLGLRHGGADHINFKPNFYSVMNYTWQTPHKHWIQEGSWRLDYSRHKLPTLHENNLDENVGFGVFPADVLPFVQVPYRDSTGTIKQAVLSPNWEADWTGDHQLLTGRQANINKLTAQSSTLGEDLVSRDDWATLVVNFRHSDNYTAANTPLELLRAGGPVIHTGELTKEIFDELESLPPPKPEGVFVMDGKRDPNSMLIGSNNGMNLYAALKPGSLGTQLYLAVDGAVAGRDQVVLVSGTPGSMRAAPLGKSGQVAGWTALLDRLGTAAAAEWQDNTGTPFEQIVVDSAATFLEGVVHLDLLLGQVATSCKVALASYASGPGGVLIGQVPAGNGNGDLEPNEWIALATSNVDVPEDVVTPGIGRIALTNALPNPANGPARVRLTLPAAADVLVTVRNVAGRTVATLVRERMIAGTHELLWNPDEGASRRTPPGVYFIVVEALGQTRSTRVVVVD